MMIDSLDEQLINLLVRDARQSSKVLAEQLCVSSSTIRRRVNKLIQQGVLRIVALPEPGKVGFSLRVIIAFNVAHEKLNAIMEALNSRSEVKALNATSGRFDIIAYMWFHSTDELFDFMENEIGKLEGIKNTETFICLHVRKDF